MNNKWEDAVQFIGKRLVGGHEITLPLDGKRAVEGIINRMIVFQCDLKSRVRYCPGRTQGKGQGEQVSIDKRRLIGGQLPANNDALPECACRLHQHEVGSQKFNFIVQEFLEKKIGGS